MSEPGLSCWQQIEPRPQQINELAINIIIAWIRHSNTKKQIVADATWQCKTFKIAITQLRVKTNSDRVGINIWIKEYEQKDQEMKNKYVAIIAEKEEYIRVLEGIIG